MARSWSLISFSNETNQDSLKKWLILGLGQEIHKTILEQIVGPENREVPHKATTITKSRASLVAQWLRIRLPMQGTRVRALVWEDPTCCGAAGPVSHNY